MRIVTSFGKLIYFHNMQVTGAYIMSLHVLYNTRDKFCLVIFFVSKTILISDRTYLVHSCKSQRCLCLRNTVCMRIYKPFCKYCLKPWITRGFAKELGPNQTHVSTQHAIPVHTLYGLLLVKTIFKT